MLGNTVDVPYTALAVDLANDYNQGTEINQSRMIANMSIVIFTSDNSMGCRYYIFTVYHSFYYRR